MLTWLKSKIVWILITIGFLGVAYGQAVTTPDDLLITSLEADQEQCFIDTGSYCSVKPYMIGNIEYMVLTHRGGKDYPNDGQSYTIMTKEFPTNKITSTSTMKIHKKGKPVEVVLNFVVEERILKDNIENAKIQ